MSALTMVVVACACAYENFCIPGTNHGDDGKRFGRCIINRQSARVKCMIC